MNTVKYTLYYDDGTIRAVLAARKDDMVFFAQCTLAAGAVGGWPDNLKFAGPLKLWTPDDGQSGPVRWTDLND